MYYSYLLENCKLLDIGHNGDPHMLWLFEGGNVNPNPPIWSYDSTKIEDPLYSRVGLKSYDIATLNLYPAVAFNGACHSGVPKRAIVENDIAATFGNTNGIVQFYTMSDTFSFCLSMLKTGITGYFAPCGSNNANDQFEDVYNAFLYNEPLGDIHKRSNDAVVMGFFGNRPNLKIFYQGQSTYGCDILSSGAFNPNQWSGACYMLGGKANRIYFGDPLYNPFSQNHSQQLNITQYSIEWLNSNSFIVHINFNKPDAFIAYFPVWDKFHFGNTRIYVPVELPNNILSVQNYQIINASSVYDTTFYAFEVFDNKSIIHIEINIPDDFYDAINFNISIKFDVLVSEQEFKEENNSTFHLYPNPTNDDIYLLFKDNAQNVNVEIYDLAGKFVCKYDLKNANNNSVVPLNLSFLNTGNYFIRIYGKNFSEWKKIIKI